jgi:predicted ribosome quality control (RQC) complex YloA/Tae2 family protein
MSKGLTAHHLGQLAGEVAPLIRGAHVREVSALPPRDLLVVLVEPAERGGRVLRLRVSADAEAGRVHLQIGPVRRHEGPSASFFQTLGRALEDTEVFALEAVPDDRIVRLVVRREGRPAATLVAELTGRHANLVLLDGGGRVVEVLVPPGPGTAAAERLASGTAWALPPGRRQASPGPGIEEAYPTAAATGGLAERAPLSARVEAALGSRAAERHLEGRRGDLLRRLERRLEGGRALLAGLTERVRACAAAERVQQDGELLLAHLTEIPRGVDEVQLPDAHGDPSASRRIALDPGLSPRRNAEKLFARAKKLRRTAERVPEEQALAQATLARLEALQQSLESADEEALEELERQAIDEGLLPAPQEIPRRVRRPEPRRPYLRFVTGRGSEVRVGRSAADNDRLTFRESRGNDLWLHTADTPGSHVILRLEGSADPDPDDVLDAAHLAAHFSPLRGSPRVDVHVARRKLVSKPRKAPPGLVTLSGGKVLRVRVEPERLRRLLDTRGRPSSEDGPPGTGPGS